MILPTARATLEPPLSLNLQELLERHPELQIPQDDYNINVTANEGRRLTAAKTLALYAEHDGAGRPAHLYFHIPLCTYICRFCNYVKKLLPASGDREQELARWTDLLIEESKRCLERFDWISSARIESFYLGGGTASLLGSSHLTRLMEHVRHHFDLSSCSEVTLEGNPDNFQDNEVLAAREIGFNRFSLGVQSFQSEVLEFAGRGHDVEMSLCAIEKLIASGCPFNVDMMFGLPRQTVAAVARDLEILVRRKVPTITIYRFRNADRQAMGIGNRSAWNVEGVRKRLNQEGLCPSLRQTYQMREAAMEVLLGSGYTASPCGWWSAPGVYPDGNIPRVSRNKWQRYDTMIAFGPGAYGWLTGDGARVVQTHNEADIAAYRRRMETEAGPPLSFGRLLMGRQAVASALGFAFKANQPIEVARFRRQYGVDLLRDEPYAEVLGELLRSGFLGYDEGRASLKPTLLGEAFHEEIISVYLHQGIGSFERPACLK